MQQTSKSIFEQSAPNYNFAYIKSFKEKGKYYRTLSVFLVQLFFTMTYCYNTPLSQMSYLSSEP